MSMKNTITIIILSVLAIGSYLFLKSLTPKEALKTDDQSKFVIATVSGVKARYFNEKNQLHYLLTSPKVLEYSNHYGTEFTSPDLTTFDEQVQPAWTGNADTGTLSGDKNTLLLENNVKIVQTPQGENPTHITGEKMRYQAQKRLLTSDLPVTIDDGIMMQVSDKLRLNTRSKQVNASDRVKATYKTKSTTKE